MAIKGFPGHHFSGYHGHHFGGHHGHNGYPAHHGHQDSQKQVLNAKTQLIESKIAALTELNQNTTTTTTTVAAPPTPQQQIDSVIGSFSQILGLFYIFGEFKFSNINSNVFRKDIPFQGIF
ncbi:hypothetical protein ACTFIY_010723 [Dictyostelium cf. discoideum]